MRGLGFMAGAVSPWLMPGLVPLLAPVTPLLIAAGATAIGFSVYRDFKRRGDRTSKGVPGSSAAFALAIGMVNGSVVLASMVLPSPISVGFLLGCVGKEVGAGVFGFADEARRRFNLSYDRLELPNAASYGELRESKSVAKKQPTRAPARTATTEFSRQVDRLSPQSEAVSALRANRNSRHVPSRSRGRVP